MAAHGTVLQDLLVSRARAADLRDGSRTWPSWELTPRQLCDLELLLNGGFWPLCGFMTRNDHEAVCHGMRLADGTLWPIPITLDVAEEFAQRLEAGAAIALRDPEGVMLAVLRVEDVWTSDRLEEAQLVYRTTDPGHPGVAALLDRANPWRVGGRIEGVQLPTHYDFRALRLTPGELREEFGRLGWSRVVAFQTHDPTDRAHQESALRAARDAQAGLLIHVMAGMRNPVDADHYARVRCYQRLTSACPPDTAKLALLPLAPRMAEPRETLWQAIVSRNYGCTHLIPAGDHADPGCDSAGEPLHGAHEAQDLLRRHQAELGIEMVSCRRMVYVEDHDRYLPDDEVPTGARVHRVSEGELTQRLADGREIPHWLTFPDVVDELRRRHPPRPRQGFTIFFTGLSGAGKSTIANVLLVRFMEMGGRPVTLLDGDLVRRHLSSELGFSREHRDLNIRRIGFVAAEITKNAGIAICAPIAPYHRVRREVRKLVEAVGGFVLVHVSTPFEVCEQRDRKGLYAKARAGLITQFTGISDPYEAPGDAEVTIDTTMTTPDEASDRILAHLRREGYLPV
jgi:sulfate adenylyltransferase